MSTKRKLFIGCSRAARHIADWIKSEVESNGVDVDIIIWDAKINWRNARSALESLTLMTKDFYYAIFVYYPDDLIKLGANEFFITRDNVIFESGLFFSKFGDKRTFILKPELNNHPTINTFRVLTDFSGIEFTYYKLLYDSAKDSWNVDNSNPFTKDNVTKLCNDIKTRETKLNTTQADVENNIIQVNNLIEADLREDGQPDEFYIGNFAEKLDDLIRFKAIQIGKEPQHILTDILLSIKKIDDVLDIKQLAEEQSKANNGNISKVWVFSDFPLEFRPRRGDKRLREQLDELRKTVLLNLNDGVKYVYFVNDSFNPRDLDSLVGTDKKLLENIEIIKVDSKHFLTFFTLHFEKHTDPSEIYVSLIDKQREDLLIKLPDAQKNRIFENLNKIKGLSEINPPYRIFDRVNR